MTTNELFTLSAKKIDNSIYDDACKKWDSISKPLDGLGDFEKVTSKILALNGNAEITQYKKILVVMCADHGIVEEGVSQCGQEVTFQVAKLLGEGRSTASKMASFAGADCMAVDVGINSDVVLPDVKNEKVKRGTNNFLVTPAMTIDDVLDAIDVGIRIARECKENGYHILAAGEMGIGNTTSGTALLCALTGVELEQVLGRGAGLSDEGLERKRSVILQALDLHGLKNVQCEEAKISDSGGNVGFIDKKLAGLTDKAKYTLNAMSKVGGLELAAMTGLFIGGAVYGIPVMIDGVLCAVSALCASRIMPESVGYMIPSHAGREKGTSYVLDLLGLKPFINGDMALGEGTGALMTMPLLDMAIDFYVKATTFEQGQIEQYVRQN